MKEEPTPQEGEPSSYLSVQVGADQGVHEIVLAGMQASETVQHVVRIHVDSDVLHVHVVSELGIYSDWHQHDPKFLEGFEYYSKDSFAEYSRVFISLAFKEPLARFRFWQPGQQSDIPARGSLAESESQ